MTAIKSEHVDWKFMLPLVLGTMMNPLNSTMLTTALTVLCNHFAREASSGALLITPLYIAATIGQPLMGRLADIFNPKLINQLGFILVLIAALVGIFAPAFEWLIVSRVLLGIGTSASYPSAMAIIANKYRNSHRAIPGNILGIITVAAQGTLVFGPLLGGLVTQAFGWQGVFLINVPWVLVAMYLSKNIPSPEKKQNSDFVSIFKKVDVTGILLFSVFLVLLLFALIQPTENWIYSLACLILFVLFLVWERKQEQPFIDIRLLWEQPSLLLVYVRTLGTNYILYLLLYGLPQWMEGVKMMSPSHTGLMMMPMSLMSAAISMFVSTKIKSIKWLNISGIITLIIACSSLFLLNQHSAVCAIVGVTVLVGISTGTNIIANQLSLSAEVPANKTGVSFGLFRTFGYLGAIVSATQLKTAFHNGVTDRGLHSCGWYAITSCALLTILYFARWKPKEKLGKA